MTDAVSGFLVWSDPPLRKGSDLQLARLQELREPMEHWHKYNYIVHETIPEVEVDGPPYSHLLLARWGSDRMILLSTHYRICEHFIQHDLRPSLPISIRKTDIDVHGLIGGMIEFRKIAAQARHYDTSGEKTQDAGPLTSERGLPVKDEISQEWKKFNESFDLGYAFARTDAFGGTLQKIEFTGKDLIEVPLFIDAFSVTRFRTCGLRKKIIDNHSLPDSYELVKIAKSGFLTFSVPSSPTGREQRFREVEAVLRTINKCGFMK